MSYVTIYTKPVCIIIICQVYYISNFEGYIRNLSVVVLGLLDDIR